MLRQLRVRNITINGFLKGFSYSRKKFCKSKGNKSNQQLFEKGWLTNVLGKFEIQKKNISVRLTSKT